MSDLELPDLPSRNDLELFAKDLCSKGRLIWLGFRQDEDGLYTIPVISNSDAKLVEEFAQHYARAAILADREKLAQAAQIERIKELEERKDAAYLERNQVVAALASAYPSGIARTAIDGWSEDWHGCVYIDLPTGQASWHYHDSQAYLFAHLPAYRGSWDGHTTDEKYVRLAALATQQEAPTASNERGEFEWWWFADATVDALESARSVEAECWLAWQARAALATQQEAQPQEERDVDRLLHQVFLLCEAVEDAPAVDPKNEHERGFDRGRRFEAKQIRRAIGDWFQWTFCGRSFMGEPVIESATQAEPAGGDKEDAERWRAFISLPYAVRSEWATNLSLAPVLTGWLDSRASYLRLGEAPARGDDGLSASDADQLELAIGELEDDGETMVDYDDLMWFALRGYLHCKYFEVKPEAQEAIDAARAAQQATGERG